MQGDDPWFVASDAAKSLGYDNPANAINTHCKKTNKITLSPDLGGREISSKMPPVVMNIIPESDVYRLVMRSNLPNAVAFQDWVCEEVLPAIRKTGEYSTTLPDFTNPAEAARAWADEYEKNLALTAANQQLTEEKEMLEIVIGNAREWKAVTAIPWLKHSFRQTWLGIMQPTRSRFCTRRPIHSYSDSTLSAMKPDNCLYQQRIRS